MVNILSKGPRPLSISEIDLPMARIDHLFPLGPTFLYSVVSKVLGFNLKTFSLPEGLTGKSKIPGYALQEFHGLPNGYYSATVASGYAAGFNNVMLGEMARVRKEVAQELVGCKSVLDLGCGDGSTTKFLTDAGIEDVWGLDPSPYLLAQALERVPKAHFVQGIAENTEFQSESFDGICACWVLHEVPADICDLIIKECFRILKPGGKLVLMEPSKHQFRKSYFQLFKEFGIKGLYYRFIANLAHEPFIQEWQDREIKPWLESAGFELLANENRMPEEKIVARKKS